MDMGGSRPASISAVTMRMMSDFSTVEKAKAAGESFGMRAVACKSTGTCECGSSVLLDIRRRWAMASSVSCRKKRIRNGKATYKTDSGLMNGLLKNCKQKCDADALPPACSWNVDR